MNLAKIKGPFKIATRALAILVIMAASWVLGLRLTGNVHEVDDTQVFRSAQLSPARLTELVKAKGIKTIINLRGEHPEDGWYRDEVSAGESLGLAYENLALSANHEPDDATLKRLVELIRNAKRPLLIHCEAGADRSGLASALYRLAVKGDPPDIAARQLSFRYGHFPWLWSGTGAMDRAFWRVVAAPELIRSND
jgi:protein tyrosine/serine phosphatase